MAIKNIHRRKYSQLSDEEKQGMSKADYKAAKSKAQAARKEKKVKKNEKANQKAQKLINKRVEKMKSSDNVQSVADIQKKQEAQRQATQQANPQSSAPQQAATAENSNAALNNAHSPNADPQAGSVTYETRDQLPSYKAGDISHHKQRTNETDKEWAAYMKTDRGRIEQQEKWLNPEYRAQREAQDGRKYTATGAVKRDDSTYRNALLESKGQEALDKYDALMDPDKRYAEAASSAADARQRYEFTAAGGAGGEAGRYQRQQQKFNGGSPFGDDLKMLNASIEYETNQVKSPKTGQIETVNTYKNPQMMRDVTGAQNQSWKDYITYGKMPDFSNVINKYGITKGQNFDGRN